MVRLEGTSGGQVVQLRAKAGSPRADYTGKECVQVGFECLQRWTLYDLPGQPVSVFCYPKCKEVLPHVVVELLVV